MKVLEVSRDRRLLFALALALVLSVGWAGTAYAGTPFDSQYGSSSSSVDELGGSGDQGGSSGASGGSTSGDSAALVEALPDTGGPMLIMIAVLAAMLLGLGLLVARRVSRS